MTVIVALIWIVLHLWAVAVVVLLQWAFSARGRTGLRVFCIIAATLNIYLALDRVAQLFR